MSTPGPLGHRIRAARTAAGLTQSALAAAVRCHPITLTRIELGTRNPSRGLVALIAAECGVAPAILAPEMFPRPARPRSERCNPTKET